MGASSSKAARGAARKYPTQASKAATTRPSGATGHLTSQHTSNHAKANSAHEGGDQFDGVPGGFSQRLQQMGVVQPNPTPKESNSVRTRVPTAASTTGRAGP
ncbi:hypothetical protein N3K66_002279 [Trichothecium roseum]|uniref:Uncharacterized protein n=1 Tax=Trichothecium roseum TaxID=47278 RepID=A0ACC0V949_9HYPO|nr:hypothetical protein N3K66_002279 [Trichothecium roseum]